MSSLIRWEPFRDNCTLQDRKDRLFGEVSHRPGATDEGFTAGPWTPLVDVYETNDSIVLKADLPGMTQNDVEISVEGNTLTVKGERKFEKEVSEKEYYRMERSYGTFTRSFTLPPTADSDKIDAAFSQGVLKIALPKREESKPKQIKVKINGSQNKAILRKGVSGSIRPRTHGLFLSPLPGLVGFACFVPRLTPWARILRPSGASERDTPSRKMV